MNERIQKLRNQSINAEPTLSIERAHLLTKFYQSQQSPEKPLNSTPITRALAFQYLLEHKTICVNEGELIVGERGSAPGVTPTYPEICCHSQKDLDILNNREKIFFRVDQETKNLNEVVVSPFWKNKSIRDIVFDTVDSDWINAYEAGIFTEFMEQRAPGHTVAGKQVFEKGMLDFIEEIQTSIQKLDWFKDPESLQKREQLRAMEIAANAIITFAHRHSTKLWELSQNEEDPKRKAELVQMAEICNYVPAHAPRTLWEALQHYWFIHLGVITELNTWDSFNPGRLDQNLFPLYEADLQSQRIDEDSARELLQAFWIKFNNQPAPPKVGVTAEESNTYTDFCNINLGGLKTDGSDGVNELSYLILDVIEEMRILQPSSNVQISKKTPDRFLKRALNIVKTGFGQPSIFNADAIIQELTRQGKDIIDARLSGASGCVEVGAFGKEAYILTGYFNLVKVLEITLHNGFDPRTNKHIGLKTGEISRFDTFSQLYDAFTKQLRHFINIKIKGNLIIEQIWGRTLPAVFLSILIEDCIIQGKDYNAGGARYNSSYIQIVGMGSIADSLAALKYHVYDNPTLTLSQFVSIIDKDFAGEESFRIKLIESTPKYGNDDEYVDQLGKRVFETVFSAIDGRPNTKGGQHRINLLPTTVHVYFGSVIGATPDGRRAMMPLSEGISPVQGADTNGPTAVIKSASKLDHLRTGGTLLNQKFSPTMFTDDLGIQKVLHLIRAYFKMDGHHIQFNVVDAKTLKAAQASPEQYRNLIVRVAGYSDYFVNLGQKLQDEIIMRTEHQNI
ncbi:MAG: trans-4-hydroxy-L-proline dehydratase [Promethearchaeota archaeon]